MIITTSKGNEYAANWIFGPLRGTGHLMMEIKDARKISEIAVEMEDCSAIRARKGEKDGEPVTLYEGYTELISVAPGAETGVRQITLAKPKEG